ncbi:DNA polymerase III subunit gamma/tau [Cupriavidus basilensis]|uniref:DNA polymerase III subunit gamma/tau n=1 Tax=Cupriavidus basilensis TaxID=68895 RepID=A0A7M2GR26_9BURK|nr:DNA polymerase III subunit gamma/tau [Cupriavidus basilensis]QOT74988.1 DNA polymerase III subunit gamma/tau [Cupriavidus basilensis]
MSYQVLARKWRPRDFTTLVGQEHVVRALTHALEQQRLHHAYLFTGTRGVGKTTLSRILAKALNCIGPDGTGDITAQPCGVCKACTEIDSGRFVDYIEMDAASNRGVDEMASLLDKAVYAPTAGRFKVYMIDEVHMLTNHAFNAMLKTLEEPPAHVKFILATTDPQKIPVTVLSRCLQFNLKQMPPGHIVSHLDHVLGEEGIVREPNALRLLAQAAHGSMRDALSLTDQAIAYSAGQVSEAAVRGMLGAIDQSYLVQLLDALAAEDGAAMLAVADGMADRSLSFAGALQDLASLLHKIALAQAVPASVQEEWPEAAEVRRFAAAFDAQEVQLFYQIANLGRSELALAPDEYAGFTMTLLRMLAFRPSASPTPAVAQGGGQQVPRARGGAAPAARVAADAAAASAAVAPVAPSLRAAAPMPAADPSPVQAQQPVPAPTPAAPARTLSPAPAAVAPAAAPAAGAPMSPARAALAAARLASAARAGGSPRMPPPAAAAPAAPAARPPSAQPLRPPGPPAAVSRPAASMPAAQAAAPTHREPASARQAVADARHVRDSGPSDDVPPWEHAGSSDVPPWEDLPPDLPVIGPYDSDPEPMPSRQAAPRREPAPRAAPPAPAAVQAAPAEPVAPVRLTPPKPPVAGEDGTPPVFTGAWPALAASLPLKGLAQQLAYQSELVQVVGRTFHLRAPVAPITEAGVVERLQQTLAEHLGTDVRVQCEIGAVADTAAAADAQARAERQREAEATIEGDPFVQGLLREFGGTILEGSIQPRAA